MLLRHINPPKNKSFFLFGARGVGKTTFLLEHFKAIRTLRFDLLDPETEDRFLLNPSSFRLEVLAQQGNFDWIIVDEIQKCPRILNLVHKMIVENGFLFALTGSSARKLRQKGVNLLAGRAFSETLFPFTFLELGDDFDLNSALHFGTLPECIGLQDDSLKERFLRSYALNFLQHEVQAEQWVRNLDPFRKFLGVAAQANGKILNYSNIAKDVGTSAPTIHSYFDILEDSYIGFRLPAFHNSIRKQQRMAPKFYFFDLGVKRALERSLESRMSPSTSVYGEAFEHFAILEIWRFLKYNKPDAEMSYFLSKDGAEIDLIVSQVGMPTVLVEIKSKVQVDERDARHLQRFKDDFTGAHRYLLSQDPNAKLIDGVKALHWRHGITEITAPNRSD